MIGWSTSKTMKAADTVISAWNMAILNRPIIGRLIFHSDQGIQYACNDFRAVLRKAKIVIQSMIGKVIVGIMLAQRVFLRVLKPNGYIASNIKHSKPLYYLFLNI